MNTHADLRARLLPVIRSHLRLHGDAQWSLVRRPSEVPYSTWRRWIRQESAALKAEPITVVADAGDAAMNHEITSQAVAQAGRTLRRALGGPIDVMAEVGRMLVLCDQLDRAAVDAQGDDPDRWQVKDPRALAEAVRTRAAVLRIGIEAHDKLAGLSRVYQLQKLLLREIERCAPEMARALYQGLDALDREYGITAGRIEPD